VIWNSGFHHLLADLTVIWGSSRDVDVCLDLKLYKYELVLCTKEPTLNESGRTPLSRAAGNGREAVVKLLLLEAKASLVEGEFTSAFGVWPTANSQYPSFRFYYRKPFSD
jgi:ankyrin repeat protein